VAAFSGRMNEPQTTLTSREDRGALRMRLIRGTAGTFALKVISVCVAFVSSVVLARIMGAEGLGIYSYAIAWVTLLEIPARLGLPQVVVREMAALESRSAWKEIRGLLLRSSQAALVGSVSVIILAATVSWIFKDKFDSTMLMAFWIALPSVPLAVFLEVWGAALRALKHVVVSQAPSTLGRPLLFLALVVVGWWATGESFGPLWVVGFYVMATGVSLLALGSLLRRRMAREVQFAAPTFATNAWARGAGSFIVLGGLNMINQQTDILMLGALSGAEAVGVYRVADRGAELVLFALLVVNIVLGPTIARLHAVDDQARLQRVITASARAVIAISLPVALTMIFLGSTVLSVFGEQFTRGTSALAILATAQLFNAATGSVVLLLNMTGHERITAQVVALTAALNILLNALFIPRWDIDGAAIATGISLVMLNTTLMVRVHRKLGIHPTALGRLSFGRRAT